MGPTRQYNAQNQDDATRLSSLLVTKQAPWFTCEANKGGGYLFTVQREQAPIVQESHLATAIIE